MDEKGIPLTEDMGLEEWLTSHDDSCFPSYSEDNGEMSYIDRYNALKKALMPVHNNIEISVMAKGAIDWMEKSIEIIKGQPDSPDEIESKLQSLIDSDPVIYLNNHGKGHVEKVIQRASEILRFFNDEHLTPYEGFFLLCAIQVHDIGNIYGREGHEKSCKQVLEEKSKNIIKDSFEKKIIEKLALVHGGAYRGDRDTIGHLSESRPLHERSIRKKLLAALLRFSDEIADDYTRANHESVESDTLPIGSLIYHRYSEALHTVLLKRNSVTKKLELILAYEFDSNIATHVFKKNGVDKYLLDEIYDRTIKMERERRYCMRFLRPFFSLDRIKVEIIIENSNNSFENDKIQYTLEENGYPSEPLLGNLMAAKELRSGKDEATYLTRTWNLQ